MLVMQLVNKLRAEKDDFVVDHYCETAETMPNLLDYFCGEQPTGKVTITLTGHYELKPSRKTPRKRDVVNTRKGKR